MKTVHLPQLGKEVALATRDRLLDALLAEEVDVLMACGGQGMCATCHVFVVEGEDQLTPMNRREQRTLSRISSTRSNSRLACQACVLGEGVRVEMPSGLYVQSQEDLEALVGKRARQPILHPVDGRVLIQRRKIITRTAILSLRDTDFTIASADVEGDDR